MLTDTESVFFAIGICVISAIALGAILRRGPGSLGLPFAYCALVLLEHVPGAWAAVAGNLSYARIGFVKTGIWFTAAALCAFVLGVWISRRFAGERSFVRTDRELRSVLATVPTRFLLFCLVGGWSLIFAVRFVVDLPSINAIVEKGGAIWLLAVMIGLSRSISFRSSRALLWVGALLVYPSFVLVIGGFASWGSAIIVMAASLWSVVAKRYWVFLLSCAAASVVGISLFVSYFEVRNDLRAAAWGGAPISERASQAARIFTEFEIISPDNHEDLKALDERLNQNYFIGVAARRLEQGQVQYLSGRSIWEGTIALVPRILWPNKPVFGGSGDIVRDTTGLALERRNTAWGVGSVMEFYVNFGAAGLVVGFVLFGFILGRLDLGAGRNLAARNYGGTIIYFLPGVALVQPLGSFVELTSGAAAAFLAACAWRWGWVRVSSNSLPPPQWRHSLLGPKHSRQRPLTAMDPVRSAALPSSDQ